jgi:hypothetical protein
VAERQASNRKWHATQKKSWLCKIRDRREEDLRQLANQATTSNEVVERAAATAAASTAVPRLVVVAGRGPVSDDDSEDIESVGPGEEILLNVAETLKTIRSSTGEYRTKTGA